jgi:hypothetical protein
MRTLKEILGEEKGAGKLRNEIDKLNCTVKGVTVNFSLCLIN